MANIGPNVYCHEDSIVCEMCNVTENTVEKTGQ